MIKKEVEDRGSYLLVLRLRQEKNLSVGKLGRIHFREGYYIYVGSAMANLSRRMERHRRLRKRHHWHIDELRKAADFHVCLPIRSSGRLECSIAKAMAPISEWHIPHFGTSDCRCETHLFGMAGDPLHRRPFQEILRFFRKDQLGEFDGLEKKSFFW